MAIGSSLVQNTSFIRLSYLVGTGPSVVMHLDLSRFSYKKNVILDHKSICFRSLLWSVVWVALLCCSASEHELFENSRAELAEGVGVACDAGELASGEIVIIEKSEVCSGASLCLGIGEDTDDLPALELCSCRCDGPDDTGPFCACPETYMCLHVVDDLLLGNARTSGSYCLPQ